jgi:hypothetical protein
MGKRLSLCLQPQPYHPVDDFEDLEMGNKSTCSSDDSIISVEIDFDMYLTTNTDSKL